MNEDLVEIRNLSKIFDSNTVPALDRISAVIPRGKIVGLAGPDGAGKTTLIRLIAGLLLPTAGEIFIQGYDTRVDSYQISELISYMPQRFGLYEDLTVQQNLDLYMDLKGVEKNERQNVLSQLLQFTQLSPFTGRFARDLSGGMKQKLGLACALVKKPTLLLLDEPSVGVDPISRRELWRMVKELLNQGITVLWSTAYLDEAERCDEVLLLNEGKLLFNGSPEKLTQRVEGRTFNLKGVQSNRREVLKKILDSNSVMDGLIQGEDIHILFKEKGSTLDLASLKDGNSMTLVPVPPHFEDAFIDILGGGPKGTSLLAQSTPKVLDSREIVIDAHELTKTFGAFVAADKVTFQVKRGEILGLLGPNGAGKSTTFKMLCGLLKPTSGEAFVNGVDLEKAPSEARSHIGYMAQKFSLYGDLSVWQNLNFFSSLYNLKRGKKKEAMNRMSEIFGFDKYEETSAGLLPLGYKQRLALACALMHHPQVLFLDEPTSGVDPITRREFWNHINGLVEKGVTILVTTHFMDEAEYCDRIALIYKSKIIEVGSPSQLKASARTKELPNPTLEDAFIQLIQKYDSKQA